MLHEITDLKERLSSATKNQEELEKKNYTADQKCDELKQALEVQFTKQKVISKLGHNL